MKSSLISPSSSSSSKPQTNYDVFLSFRGEDTRNSFTSHLYAALHQKGIYTFLDDDKLERGKSISPRLLKAIEDSRCSIIILSISYASSTWCLDELVKILQCMKDYEQIVLPIFYHVDPSHVRKQIGSIGEAFKRHEQVFSHNLEKVQSWKDALIEVGNLAGWHLHDRNEAKFIQDFIIELSGKLDVVLLNISEDLFGMDSRLEKLNLCVCTSPLDDVGFIGICGIGGIGKTTLARAYYEWMSCQFEGSSFIANIREVSEKKENGLVYLQNLLLSDILNGDSTKISDVHKGMNMIRNRLRHKKVLLILDDVDKLEQLKVLAEKDKWFGSGSRIIITTRDQSLLKSAYNECIIHRVKQFNESESLQLFSWKAFKSNNPLKDYAELSKQVVTYANGLPLAVEVLGSFLSGKRINEWKSALDRLKKYPKKEIVKVLQITFDGLEETEKSIFLDIACFFNGLHKDYITQIMDSCGFFPEIGIRVLVDKSLLHVSHDNELWMHDLLQEMGMDIVQEKSRNEPGRRSRIWDTNDICHVFENNAGMEEVEAIVCHFPIERKKLSCKAFSYMKKLRFLILCNVWLFDGGFIPNLEYLSNELRLLEWEKFPSKYLPSSFQPDGLVELKLQWSNIKQLWNKPIKPLHNLKVIDLSNSLSFSKFEDFKVFPNLEKLILQGCEQLLEVHPSITFLKRLTLLNLKYCYSLENLPTSIGGLESLKVLELDGCRRLLDLPEDLGHLNSLKELNVTDTAVSVLPSSILLLKNLKTLSCGGVEISGEGKNIINIIFQKGLFSAGLICSLKKLDLSSCNLGEGAIPENFGCLASLEDLDLSYNCFSCLPTSFNQLSKLWILRLRLCKNLKSLGPELPPNLEIVRVDKCTSLDSFLDPLDERCNLWCSAWCLDCFELVRRQGSKRTAFASLKRYLQNPHNLSRRFDIVLPGNEIPAWFTHRSFESSISLQHGPNWCNSKWRGFAVSVCFLSNTHSNFHCDIRINGQDWGFGHIKSNSSRVGSLEHLWLLYLPRGAYFCEEWQNNNNGVIEFSFESHNSEVFFGACGIRLVHEQDILDLNSNVIDCINFPGVAEINRRD